MKSSIKKIGPAEAKQYLANNTMNRQLHHSQIRLYARLMSEGKWKLIPAPLVISKEGILLQGQHRLNAVVDSATSQEFLVCEGIDKELFPLIDAGISRSSADSLFIEGFQYPELYASVCYNFIKWTNGSFWGHGNKAASPSSIEVLEFAKANKEPLALSVNFVKGIKGRGKYISERVFSSSFHIIRAESKKSPEDIMDFFRDMMSEEPDDEALLWLRDNMEINKNSTRKLQWQQIYRSVFYAWNGYKAKRFITVNPENLRDILPG